MASDHLQARGRKITGDREVGGVPGSPREALPESGGKLGLRARLQDTDLLIEIGDNGAGADNLTVDEIDTKQRRDYRTGLKLTKAIVEQHGGTMKINSEAGTGTFVRMSLPLRLEA